nr:MAG TPA: hypothetical protein [Caudoviricetes sp.]
MMRNKTRGLRPPCFSLSQKKISKTFSPYG